VRRGLLVSMMGVLGALLAGCLPPPPSGWTPPVIHSISFSADPVVAGEPFVVRVIAEDDELVDSASLSVQPVDSSTGLIYFVCEAPPFAPAAKITLDFSCAIDESAPKGDWYAFVTLTNARSTQVQKVVLTFEVV
jgi:hypothetical protein